jgi:hypothetical protein
MHIGLLIWLASLARHVEDMTKRGPIPLLAPSELQELAPQSEETYEIRPAGARCFADW